MSNSNRVNLDGDLDALLRDVKAATEEVKQRQDQQKQKEIKDAEKQQTKKSSVLLIAVATVVLLIGAYFVVFARSPEKQSQTVYSNSAPAPTPNVSNVPKNITPNAPVPTPAPTQPAQAQRVPQNSAPPTDYEQPTGSM